MSHFIPSTSDGVTMIEVNGSNTVLATGDSTGHIRLYNISEYCKEGIERQAPPLLSTWRAHTSSITCFDFILDLCAYELLLSGSDDCSVRLWTGKGHYVGTLGQTARWDIRDEESYAHPRVPKDVLVEPIELPTVVPETHHNIDKFTIDMDDDDDYDVCSTNMEDDASNGTRLRHIKHKPSPKTHGGPAVYHCLPCFELTNVPPSRSAPQTSSLDPLSILDTVEIESVHSENLSMRPITPKMSLKNMRKVS